MYSVGLSEGLSPRDAAFRGHERSYAGRHRDCFRLSAVFIPVAFIPGITGRFYQQFALTIAFSTLLSAFNSLTLSPALSALLLRPHDSEAGLAYEGIRLHARLVFSAVQSGLSMLTNRWYYKVAALCSPLRDHRADWFISVWFIWPTVCSKSCPPVSFQRRTREISW